MLINKINVYLLNKKYIMKKVLMLVVVVLFMSCGSLQNICKKYERLNGEIIYAIPTPRCTRVVYLKIDNKIIKVYGVPVEQPLNNIPVCKHHGKYYWIMP